MKKSMRPKGATKPGHRRGPLPLSKRLKTKAQKLARQETILRRAEEKEAQRLLAQAAARRLHKKET